MSPSECGVDMFARLVCLVAAVVLLGLSGRATAQPAERAAVATSSSPAATFAVRRGVDADFRPLPDKGEFFGGDLVVSLPGGTLTSKNGAVTVKSLADFDSKSPLPILETALSLAEPKDKDADLDLTLDRGRVDVTNARSEGAATVRIRFWDQSWKIVLESPGSRVSAELCGRWPAGARFAVADPNADPAKAPAPVATVVFLVLKGSASVDVGGTTMAMKAPPGPAELRWNSVTGVRAQPQKLEKLPEWADPDAALSDDGKKLAAACEKFRAARAADPAKAFDTFLASTDPVEQRVALVALGGLDDLERLGKALVAAKTTEQWDFGITILRHWLGRCRGQDQRMYEVLTTRRGYTAVEAQIIMQLLFGFSPEDAAVSETYEVLIDYLAHEKPAIRNLAVWHLVRLVPQGKTIAFKPDGNADDAEKCRAAWKKLVPAGEVPPRPKKQ
jgi:hypothetical protein